MPPSQSSTASPTARIASAGSRRRTAGVIRVSRVPKQNTSTFRPVIAAAWAKCTSGRLYGAMDPDTSKISTSGRLLVRRERQARRKGSPSVRIDARRVPRISKRSPVVARR